MPASAETAEPADAAGPAATADSPAGAVAGGKAAKAAGQPIVLLGALSALAALSLDMYVPGLPALAADLHTTASSAQLTLTACLIGLALGQLLTGPLSDAEDGDARCWPGWPRTRPPPCCARWRRPSGC